MVDNNKEVEDFNRELESGIIELEPNTDEEKQLVEELMSALSQYKIMPMPNNALTSLCVLLIGKVRGKGVAKRNKNKFINVANQPNGNHLNQKDVNIIIEKFIMGDTFENISNSTIINKSLVENSYNKISEQYGQQTGEALLKIAEFIHSSNDPAAGTLFDKFNEELRKPTPDKSLLKRIWSGIERVLPYISTISNAVIAIAPLMG
jgi:hypothetical protein